MNMKWFKKYALPAILAAIVPISANAASTFTFKDYTGTLNGDGVIVGARLTETSVSSTFGDGAFTSNGSAAPGSIYNLGAFDVTFNPKDDFQAALFASNDEAGVFNLNGDIVIKTGNTTSNTALDALNMNVAAGFTGKILGGKNITVTNTGTRGAGDSKAAEAYGIRFYGTSTSGQGAIANGGEIDLGTVTVQGNSFAAAMVVGDIEDGAIVHIDAANVSSTGDVAVGVHVNTANVPSVGGGTLTVDSMNIVSETKAAEGLVFSKGGGEMIATDGGTAVTLGSVNVTGKTAASGIRAEALSNITLTGDVTATADDNAYGITATSADFKAVGDVAISGTTEGIMTTAGLIANLEEGANLKVSSTKAGGALTVTGEGTADLGKTTVSGATSITDADVTFAADSTFATTGNSVTGGSVTIVGEVVDLTAANGAKVWETATGGGTVEIKSDLGNYVLDGGIFAKTGTSNMSTGFVSAATVHQRYSTWNTVRNQMISAADLGNYSGDYRGQECDPCDPIGACDPCGSFGNQKLQRTAWVNYIGRAEEYDASNGSGKWKLGMDGVQAGTDLYKTRRNQLGVNMGYEGGELTNGLYNKVDSENLYLGVYGAHIFRNGWDTRASFTYGWQSFDMDRAASGNATLYRSSFDGNTTESTIEFGKRFAQGAWSLRPVFGVDVMTTDLDGATENRVWGSGNNTQYFGKADMTQVFLRSGAELRWQKRRLGFDTGIFYSYDVNGDTLVTTASSTIDPTSSQVLSGSELGRELLMFNVGGSYALGRNFTVFGGYQGQAVLDTDSDAYQSVGYVGGAWKW